MRENLGKFTPKVPASSCKNSTPFFSLLPRSDFAKQWKEGRRHLKGQGRKERERENSAVSPKAKREGRGGEKTTKQLNRKEEFFFFLRRNFASKKSSQRKRRKQVCAMAKTHTSTHAHTKRNFPYFPSWFFSSSSSSFQGEEEIFRSFAAWEECAWKMELFFFFSWIEFPPFVSIFPHIFFLTLGDEKRIFCSFLSHDYFWMAFRGFWLA